MINIEFKEAQFCGGFTYGFMICEDISFDKSKWDSFICNQHLNFYGFPFYFAYFFGKFNSIKIKNVTPYIPTQDPMLDRSHILSLLNRSEQEDKLFQEQYKNV